VVALAILAVGFVTVLQLFSGSVRSAGLSEQYMKAATLARSKLNELELANFENTQLAGIFPGEENYRWELDLTPYDSSLNSEKPKIDLLKVILKILWSDGGREKNIEVATLKIAGRTYPAPDSTLESLFQGGTSSIAAPSADAPATDDGTSTTTPPASAGPGCVISGVPCGSSAIICGAFTGSVHISGT